MIKGRFNAYAWFLILFLAGIFTVSICLLLHPDMVLNGRNGLILSGLSAGVVFLLLAIWLFYVLGKVVFWVIITPNYIKIAGVFKNARIAKTTIKSIDLFSREDFRWSAGAITIGTKIELESGEKFVIADPFYRNMHLLKAFLANHYNDKIRPVQIKRSNQLDKIGAEEDFEKFGGNVFTSFNGLLFTGILIFIAVTLFRQPYLKTAHLFFVPFIVIFYLAIGSQLHYFLISDKRLIVKNHFLFWRKKMYFVEDIIEVNFESQNRRSDLLRITTKNYRSRAYSAGSLRSKHWKKLRGKLENLDIHMV